MYVLYLLFAIRTRKILNNNIGYIRVFSFINMIIWKSMFDG